MSVFDVEQQNSDLDKKIVAGLERLSLVFRVLLWQKAKEHSLSPIQIQLMIFIRHHSADKSTVSYLAQEFNLTKPTISDAIKVLAEKKLITKVTDDDDSRSYTIELTRAGKSIVAETEDFPDPVFALIGKVPEREKTVLWQNISRLIIQLNKLGVISVQRTCFACTHHSLKGGKHYCGLLDQVLEQQDIRIDCREFEPA